MSDETVSVQGEDEPLDEFSRRARAFVASFNRRREGEGTVPAPSDEAREAARRACWWSNGTDAVIEAAYAIDLPRVRAEERATTLRLREALEQIAATTPKMNLGGEYVHVPVLDAWSAQKVAADALAHFNPEAK